MGEAARSLGLASSAGVAPSAPIVAVLGATEGVGRTTIVALLARAFGDVSRSERVLAVDLDARGRGLADVLGRDCASRAAASNDTEPRSSRRARAAIDVLAPRAGAGASLDDPGNGPGLVGLMAQVATRYGAVVVDTPSDFGWSTQATLRVATSVVLVATPKPEGIASVVLAARRLARVTPGRVAWIVVNQATPRAARATFAAIEDCCAALNGASDIELRFLCAVAPDAALSGAPTTPRLGAGSGLDASSSAWNLAAARRAAGMLTNEVWS